MILQPKEKKPPELEHPFDLPLTEKMLCDIIRPSDNPVQCQLLAEAFQTVILDGFLRKVKYDVFLPVVQRSLDGIATIIRLECAVTYRDGLRNMGQQTPTMDATIEQLLSEMRVIRHSMMAHLDLMRELPPEGVILS